VEVTTWATEEEFCASIRARWGDAYADGLEERVEGAVAAMDPLATHVLPDGCIRICLGRVCCTVSSWHLVEAKRKQLEAALGLGGR